MSNQAKLYRLNLKQLINDLGIIVDSSNKNIIQNDERPFYLELSVSKSFSAFIPIRTNLPHKYGFVTAQIGQGKSGLDYSKAYLVKKENTSNYLNGIKTISSVEYKKIDKNQSLIIGNFKNFLVEFQDKITNYTSLDYSGKRDVDYSSLQYQKSALKCCTEEIKIETSII
ncbi:hypothetical protein [Alkalibacterium sp. AK22]|uniref:hypothetical protein n=1 Tax=Alkalibacterium sp. AK22 TaxID=1229520 RepID=UPI0012DC6B3A|nr:hypothetical protein [Alkalibacterium sp. AK22]